jgi:hypothetical protein
MIHVDLSTRVTPDLQAHRFVCLRELCGHDELWDDTAIGLIDRLLVDRPGAAFGAGDARKLSLSDADRVLAAIYRSLYGDEIECHVVCTACRRAYAMGFTLTELWHSVGARDADDEPLQDHLTAGDDEGSFCFRSLRFRLPTAADLEAVAGLEPDARTHALRSRCVLDDDAAVDEALLDRVLALAGPVLDTEVESRCSECGTDQQVAFRLDEFLLSALRRELPLLTREVHELARAYRWSRHEILDMTRRERRQHAGLILADLGAGGTW